MEPMPEKVKEAVRRVGVASVYDWKLKGNKLTLWAYNRPEPVVTTLLPPKRGKG